MRGPEIQQMERHEDQQPESSQPARLWQRHCLHPDMQVLQPLQHCQGRKRSEACRSHGIVAEPVQLCLEQQEQIQ